jgi:hypothetical protein
MERARWEHDGMSMYSITENIYYSQLSSVAMLLQPERKCFTLCSTRKGLGSLSPCAIALRSSPPSHVSTCNSQRSSQLFFVRYILRTRESVYVYSYIDDVNNFCPVANLL